MARLGDAVAPLNLRTVSSNVFTDPEIATVGWTQNDMDDSGTTVTVKLPLATNARAKMQGMHEGFVKLFARTGSGTVVGGVVVAPRASELIFPVALAVESRLTVDQLAHVVHDLPVDQRLGGRGRPPAPHQGLARLTRPRARAV